MDEIKRVYVLQQVEEKKLSGREAAQRLGLSLRQVRRLLEKYQWAGAREQAGPQPQRVANGMPPTCPTNHKVFLSSLGS